MTVLDSRTESDVRMELAEQRSRLRDSRENIRRLIDNVRAIRNSADDIKAERERLNAEAKKLLDDAKEHQSRRDEINQMVGELRQKKRVVNAELRSRVDALVSAKRERQELNREAGAPREILEKQVVGGLKTLMGTDMALKNEAVLFELMFEWRDRLYVKKKADEAHQRLKEERHVKSKVETESQALYDEIGRLFEASNFEHAEAIRLFQERDEVMASANEIHSLWVQKNKDAKEEQKAIDQAKKDADSIAARMKDLEKELTKMVGWKKAKVEQEKFEGAKQKMDAGGKMSMDDLKILLDKGALK